MQDSDFSFACEEVSGGPSPWERLRVARFKAEEHISRPYVYEITLAALHASDEIDPRALVGKRATFRIATRSLPAHRVVHGIVVEAADIASATDREVYRVLLEPPLARAGHRRRYRIFLDKTIRQIIDAVLQDEPRLHLEPGATVEEDPGAPDYRPPREAFTWRVRDASRIDDVRARPYVVQYGESDLAFASRLLEAEGLSYHFENGDGACLLVITDHDGGRPRVAEGALLPPRPEIRTVGLGARLRTGKVVLDDYDWRKPKLSLVARAEGGVDEELSTYQYPGGYPDASTKGEPLAKARAERFGVEARYAVMDGVTRVLGAGSVFRIEADEQEHDGEYLATSLELAGEQAGVLTEHATDGTEPFKVRLECARRGHGKSVEASRFRPELRTPKPRIAGTQTAVVTDEPSSAGAEVHVGGPDGLSVGCVRVRFHWDKERPRHDKEPTSCWVRVNQPFAGVGEGGVWHPRVGVETIVDFEDGDPDRPIIVGRLYNGAHLPPRTRGEHSTMKSFSTPGGAVYNELTFEDQAGGELWHQNAGKDHNLDVGNCRLETVAASAVMAVGVDNAEKIGAECMVTVGANHTLTIGANQTITVAANSTTTIGGNSNHTTSADKSQTIGGSETITIGATLTETVSGSVTETYGATKSTTVAASFTETFSATETITVSGNVTVSSGATHDLTVNGPRLILVGGNVTETVAGATTHNFNSVELRLFGGEQAITAPTITKNCPIHYVNTPTFSHASGHKFEAKGSSVSQTGTSLGVTGAFAGAYGLNAHKKGVSVSVCGPHGKSSGPKLEATGLKLTIYPICTYILGVVVEA